MGEFYATLAQVSFTVLGLWLVAIQSRLADLARDPARRWGAQVVAMHLAMPGFMSLLNLAAPDSSVMWRVSFAVFAVVGLVGTILLGRSEEASSHASTVALVIAVIAYGVVALVAVFAPVVKADLGIQPLVIEAVMLSLLLLVAMQRAFALIFAGEDAADNGSAER